MACFTHVSIKTVEGTESDVIYKIILAPADRIWIAATTDDFRRLVIAGANPEFVRDASGMGQDIDGRCFISLSRSDCTMYTEAEASSAIRNNLCAIVAKEMAKAGSL
jgi:hypothetical protein